MYYSVVLIAISPVVLVSISVSVTRHNDHGNSYKGKHLIGTSLHFQRFSPLSSLQKAYLCSSRHGARRELGVIYIKMQERGSEMGLY